MKKIGMVFLGLLLSGVSWAMSPVGDWQSVDEKGEKRALVRITEDSNGQLRGTIVTLYQKPGALCHACEGDKKDKPIEGMSIMWGLKKVGANAWEDGAILDPSNGEVYHLKAELMADGQKLKLRGYIGVSLFGRTQVWTRLQ